MSITGQVGHIQLAKQSAFGTVNSTYADYRGVKITGDSLVASNNPLIAEGEIGLGRDITQAVPGGFAAAGSVNGNLRARAASVFLEGALGTRTFSSTADVYTPADDLPVWSLEKRVGSASPELLILRYQDVMVNTFTLSAPAGSLATFSAGLIAAGESRIASSVGNAVFASTSDDLLVFHGGRIMNGATGSTVARDETFQSIEVTINNNVAADEYTVRPSRFLRSLTEGVRSVEVNCTLVFENPDNYSKYTYGVTTGSGTLPHTPGYSFYMGALQVFLGNFQIAAPDTTDIRGTTLGSTTFTGATPSTVPTTGTQAVQFNIPKLAFTGLPVALASGRIVVTTSARALKQDASTDIVTGYVRPNGSASYGC